MSKTVAIVQSNYIPWKGYFDLIRRADAFVLLDDVQYTRRDWRNRNLIKTNNGLQWLTIPVDVKGQFEIKINEVTVADPSWAEDHWNKIKQWYGKAQHFKAFAPMIEEAYLSMHESSLSKINFQFIQLINKILEIETPIFWSHDFNTTNEKSTRLLELCQHLSADRYLSGPAAKSYLDVSLFQQAGMEVEWMDYTGYPIYNQLFGEFAHGVTALDLIFNEGNSAKKYLLPVI
ncbi:MAG: WbqC family protein [Cytophagales bacterium]